MFSREIQRQLEIYFSALGSNSERTIKMASGLIVLIQIILSSLAIIKGLWDNGFGEKIVALSSGTSREPASGYSRRWWKAAQATFNIFAVTLKLPIGSFPLLVLTDTSGDIVLGADRQPVRPFALFDPADSEIYAAKSIEQFVWGEPEQGVDAQE